MQGMPKHSGKNSALAVVEIFTLLSSDEERLSVLKTKLHYACRPPREQI